MTHPKKRSGEKRRFPNSNYFLTKRKSHSSYDHNLEEINNRNSSNGDNFKCFFFFFCYDINMRMYYNSICIHSLRYYQDTIKNKGYKRVYFSGVSKTASIIYRSSIMALLETATIHPSL